MLSEEQVKKFKNTIKGLSIPEADKENYEYLKERVIEDMGAEKGMEIINYVDDYEKRCLELYIKWQEEKRRNKNE